MKMADWIGRTVRLRRDMETQTGGLFLKGLRMQVDSHWRGKLHLLSEDGRYIRHVRKCYVELVEET